MYLSLSVLFVHCICNVYVELSIEVQESVLRIACIISIGKVDYQLL